MPVLTDEETFCVEYSKENCFEAMKKAIESLDEFRLEHSDSKTGVMQINCPMSGYTWGELISINFSESENKTQVKISSTSKLPSLLSKRKNAKNAQSIISKFSELINTFPKIQKNDLKQVSGDMEIRLQKLKDLYEQSLISEDEYKSKKDEILREI